ncbi:MAG: sensor histidine kinase [Oscillospiraceae bacterium]|jgi:signal transduction histidine kinase|nr:sensor histidine kinase [Oscillospiraceae bacterium]
MRLSDYLRDKAFFVAWSVAVAGFSAFLLYMVDANVYFALFVPCVYLVGAALSLVPEFVRKRSYYRELRSTLDGLDKKYLLSELVEVASFAEGNILRETLKTVSKAMNDEISRHSAASAAYREYIELWVHEIKTPIAGGKLLCENTRNARLSAELEKIDKLVEQALFYARSNNVEKDYIIKRVDLSELVSGVLRKNAPDLIERKISVETAELAHMVLTDGKWTDFILQQLIDNAVKYGCSRLRFYGERSANSVTLSVRDNGAGIPAQDLRRVFDKGFTGENGRRFGRSTGLGLYLCKKLCVKLGLDISVESRAGEGTTVKIVFPRSEMYEPYKNVSLP